MSRPQQLEARKHGQCRRGASSHGSTIEPTADTGRRTLDAGHWTVCCPITGTQTLNRGAVLIRIYTLGMNFVYELPAHGRGRGGGHISAPHQFFADSEKWRCGQIWHSYSFILCTSCVKILSPGHIRSGLQVTLSDVTLKRNLATLTSCHSQF